MPSLSLQETGQLFLLEELDCETTTSYSLTITANNSLSVCPLSSSVDILVTVGDVNDNPPILSQESYNTTIPENSLIATPILSISATDADKTVSLKFTQNPQPHVPTFHSLPTMSCSTVWYWGLAPTHSTWIKMECCQFRTH